MKVFLITLKKSKRYKALKRLKSLNQKFEVFYGYDGKKLSKNKLNKIYNSTLTRKNIGRYLSLPEIGTSASHLEIYKKIVKRNIKSAIILEDDMYISKKLISWINSGYCPSNDEIISFYATPSGFVKKKSEKKIRYKNNNFLIYKSSSHLYSCGAYHINQSTCKKILKITKNKVIGLPDWPFVYSRDNIKLKLIIPFLCTSVDEGKSFLAKDRKKYLKKKTNITKYFPDFILRIIKSFFYITHLHFLFNNYSYNYYFDHFFKKELLKLSNLFNNKYYDLSKIYFITKYHSKDLHNNLKKNLKINYS